MAAGMSAADPEVTADRPEGPIAVEGTDHVTVTGSSVEDTVAFYRDRLGMPLVRRQPNLDQPELNHRIFDTGDARLLTSFDDELGLDVEREPVPDAPVGSGVDR